MQYIKAGSPFVNWSSLQSVCTRVHDDIIIIVHDDIIIIVHDDIIIIVHDDIIIIVHDDIIIIAAKDNDVIMCSRFATYLAHLYHVILPCIHYIFLDNCSSDSDAERERNWKIIKVQTKNLPVSNPS